MVHEDFERAPLREVSLGAVFGVIHNFTQAHVGLFWQRVREDFPDVQDQPPIQFAQEPPKQGVRMDLSMRTIPPLRRTWFINKTKDQILQFQEDGLILNWRKGLDPYLRFEALRARFRSVWESLESVCVDSGLEVPMLSQVQLAYSNVFELPPNESFGIYTPSSMIDGHNDEIGFDVITKQERVSWGSDVRSPEPSLKPGILTCEFVRGGIAGSEGADRDRVYFHQTFQSFEQTENIDHFLRICDFGHDVIVENFSSLLSPRLREMFGGSRK
jgi:uncharacterized protein (TIGR04255 family)